jgi:hypothetical protein
MTAKRIWMACALAMIFGSVGCQSWCERHHPCPQPVAYAPQAPCCPQASYAPPAPQSWSGPAPAGTQMNCTCVPR